MKRCVTCSELKNETDFNWRNKLRGIRHPTCRKCHKSYRKNWYDDNREKHLENVKERKERVRKLAKEYVWVYLSQHPCSNCGEKDPMVLEFHHCRGKRYEISRMISDGLSIATIEKEINSCTVLCANCHRRVTSIEQGWFRGGK